MRIILIGYRGSGKSSVGLILARKMGLPLVSLDSEIELSAGTSIKDFVKTQGWDAFRDLETRIFLEHLSKPNAVIDCGGGIVERLENRRILCQEPWVFFLNAEIQTLYHRLADKTDRPALTQGKTFLQEIEEVYQRRLPLYRECASFEISAEASPEENALLIKERLKSEKNRRS